MRINHNISSMSTQAALFKVNRGMSKSMEKLATGLRVNKASDDAAGLSVSENLRTQVRGSRQAIKNTEDAISMLKIADGALEEQSSILQRMRELVIQAKNDTYTQTERNYMGDEFEQLTNELTRIANVTNFNGMALFNTRDRDGNQYTGNPLAGGAKTAGDGNTTFGADNIFGANDNGGVTYFNIMVGPNYNSTDSGSLQAENYFDSNSENLITLKFGQMDGDGLLKKSANNVTPITTALGTPAGHNFFSHGTTAFETSRWGNTLQDKLSNILRLIDGEDPVGVTNSGFTGTNTTGFKRINTMRAYIGAMTNRLEHNLNNLMTSEANQQAAESQIRDVDFAAETTEFTKSQILSNSATSMLAQANRVSQSVLSLLQ